ncbi:YkgJ family cysteine cluster protein [Desulforegula conservatrix]|uniref:YkgJ family cysteine cluster protein n=1 Tax=Desulforegula conservatrix TaxID=153026 RepID=UPI00041D6AF5|nr:YkgJ family cysteine cluster protein [Desulforegula conservatrix]
MTTEIKIFNEKYKQDLDHIYSDFEEFSVSFKQEAACGPGCSFCCTGSGPIDITTLEGMEILERLALMPKPMQKLVQERLRRNIRNKLHQKESECPFLQKNGLCMIYDIRPFICRRLYSLKKCGKDQGAVIHVQVNEFYKESLRRLQSLDNNGYSGHMGFILELLEDQSFRDFYLSGGFDPARIIEYGKPRKLVINCMVSGHVGETETEEE